jgi:hypothetical protein
VVNGVVTAVTGAQFKIDGTTSTGDPRSAPTRLSDLQRGRVSVSGSFTAKFSAVTLQTLRDNQTVVTLIGVLADSATDGRVHHLHLPAVKIFTDTADDGEKEIIRTYNFTAQYLRLGRPRAPKSALSPRTSTAAPDKPRCASSPGAHRATRTA